MPELPEVQALAELLNEQAVGRQIERVVITAFPVLKTYQPAPETLVGRVVSGVGRRGKFLLLHTGGNPQPLSLVVHLARAGWLRWRAVPPGGQPEPLQPATPGKGPLAARITFTDGSTIDLTEAGTQKRLALYVVTDPQQVPGIATLGPEPLDDSFTQADLAAILQGNNGQIKQVLRDQKLLAGVGNAYSDEILHAAGISPFKLAPKLSQQEIAQVYTQMRTLLTEAIQRSRGLAASDLKREKKLGLRVHGRTGQPCPVCADTVREVSFATRSLQYCPTCQTAGKVLADRRLSRLGITEAV